MYLLICCMMLADLRKMREALPLLIDRVAVPGVLVCEEGVQAFIRIGSEAVLD